MPVEISISNDSVPSGSQQQSKTHDENLQITGLKFGVIKDLSVEAPALTVSSSIPEVATSEFTRATTTVTCDDLAGTSDVVTRTSNDLAKCTADNFAGTADNLTGKSDVVTGTSDDLAGTSNDVVATSREAATSTGNNSEAEAPTQLTASIGNIWFLLTIQKLFY